MTVIDLHKISHRYGNLECDCACDEMETKQVTVQNEQEAQESLQYFTSEVVFVS